MQRNTGVAVVTGANRGMGLETCRQLAQLGYHVVLASRDQARGEQATQSLVRQGLSVTYHALEVTDPVSVKQLQQTLEARFGGADIFGPLALCQALVPGMIRRGYGRVVNVSSGGGQLATMGDFAPSYAVSKAALNALTRMVADAAREANVLVNSVDPGWVRTQMGGPGAPRSIEQGVETIVWLATLPDRGPTGGFFLDRKPIPW